MKMLNMAERNSRAYNKQKYSEKFKNLERTYNKTDVKEKDDPILSQYTCVGWTDLDISKRVIVPCNKTVQKPAQLVIPPPYPQKEKGLGVKSVSGNKGGKKGGGKSTGGKAIVQVQLCMRV